MKKLLIFSLLSAFALYGNNLLPEGGENCWQASGKWWKGKSDFTVVNGELSIIRATKDHGAGAWISKKVPVVPGQKFVIYAEVKLADLDGKGHIQATCFDAKGKEISRNIPIILYHSTNDQFVSRKAEITIPAGTDHVKISCVVNNRGTMTARNIYFGSPENAPECWNNTGKSWKGKTTFRCENGVYSILRAEQDRGAGAWIGDKLPVVPGKKYVVRSEIRIADLSGFCLVLANFLDADGKKIGEARPIMIHNVSNGQFLLHKGIVSIPANAAHVVFYLVVNNKGAAEFQKFFFGPAEHAPSDSVMKFCPPASSQYNLFANADFLKKKVGLPEYWEKADFAGQNLYDLSFDGKSLMISGGAKNQRAAFVYRFLPVEEKKFYHFSVRWKQENVSHSSNIAFRFFDVQGNQLEDVRPLSLWGSNREWITQHAVFQVPERATAAEVFAGLNGSGKAWFQEFKFNGRAHDPKNLPPTINRILNAGFEEGDFNWQFTDCFFVASGKGEIVKDARQDGNRFLRLASHSEVVYGEKAPARLSVTPGTTLYTYFTASAGGMLQLTLLNRNDTVIQQINREVAAENRWQEDQFSFAVPLDAVALELRLRSKKQTADFDSLYLGSKPFQADFLPPRFPELPEIVLPYEKMPHSTLAQCNGVPAWHIDGKPMVNSAYTLRNVTAETDKETLNYHRRVMQAGQFPLYVVGYRMSPDEYGLNSFSAMCANTDFQIRFVLSCVPDARFMVWCQQYGSKDFARKYPTEIAKVEDENQGFVHSFPGYSYGSEYFSDLSVHILKRLFAFLLKQEYGNRIVGIAPGFGNYGENNFGHIDGKWYISPHDYSPAMARFFRKWLFLEYHGNEKKLAAAWDRQPNFGFADALVPSHFQRSPRMDGLYLSAKKQRQVMDYIRCDSYSILHRVLEQCRAMKQATGNRIFTMSEIGYLQHGFLHREMQEALNSKYLDAFGPAPDYTNRGPGDDIPDNAPSASLRANGKLFMFQADVRSHRTGDKTKRFGDTADDTESRHVYLRDIGHYMITGALPYHWTFGQWFDAPEIMRTLPDLDRLMRVSRQLPRESQAQIAVVLDGKSLSLGAHDIYNAYPNNYAMQFSLNRTLEWHLLGANYDLFMLDDLLKTPDLAQYKAVIFYSVSALTDQQKEKIRLRLANENRLLLWVGIPSYFHVAGNNISGGLGNIFGPFEFEEERSVSLLSHQINLTPEFLKQAKLPEKYGRAGTFRTKIYGGFYGFEKTHRLPPVMNYPARFSVKNSSPSEVLGRYEDGSAAAVLRKMPNHTFVYWGSPILERAVLRPLLEMHGVHFYTDCPAVVYAGKKLLMFHTNQAGKQTIHLPEKAPFVYDLVERKEIAVNTDTMVFDLPAKRTTLLYFGEKEQLNQVLRQTEQEMTARLKTNQGELSKWTFEPKCSELARQIPVTSVAKPGAGGFLQDFLFLGPFPNNDLKGIDIDYLNGETSGELISGLFQTVFDGTDNAMQRDIWFRGNAKKQEVCNQWIPVHFSSPMIKAIGNELPLPFTSWMVYYLAAYISSPEEQQALLAIGSDDGEKTFLNGKTITCSRVNVRSMIPDSEVAPVTLKKGENFLLVKVSQGTGGVGHAVRFLDAGTQKPITNLTIRFQKIKK